MAIYNDPEDNLTSEEEAAPFLSSSHHHHPFDQQDIAIAEPLTPTSGPKVHVQGNLYISHALSTWNSRVFEFGAVLYLASIYRDSLLPMSIYAFTRGLSAFLFGPVVGQYIDVADRLRCVRLSIVVQRVVVAVSCGMFWALGRWVEGGGDDDGGGGGRSIRRGGGGRKEGIEMGMLVLLSMLACFEKLASIMNVVSVEKDWVVVLAGTDREVLGDMNAQMRRIDLLCKLLGPLFIGLVAGMVSTETAVSVNFVMNLVSVGIEYFAIARVYREVPGLQESKRSTAPQLSLSSVPVLSSEDDVMQSAPIPNYITSITTTNTTTTTTLAPQQRPRDLTLSHNLAHARSILRHFLQDLQMYFRHKTFLPSMAGALLYLTVLSFAGQMVTYLLSAGYTATQIAIARTFSVLFEVSATWIAPWLIRRIGPVRAGLWSSLWQVSCLVGGLSVFWVYQSGGKPGRTGNLDGSIVSASGLIVGTVISRVGLWSFDLCTQSIVQEDVQPSKRGAFSSVEAAWQNGFELLSFASTMVFSRPDQFKWPALLSVVAVGLASAAYTFYVRIRRGHLVHLEKCSGCLGHESLE